MAAEYMASCDSFLTNVPIDVKRFSCIQDLQYVVSEGMTTKQDEFEERLNNLDEVKSNDTQKITQFNNYF